MIFHSRVDASVRMSTLYVEKGIVPGEIFEINKRVMIIGRSNDSDIFLADMLVSRSHATLQNLNKGHSTIRDNESINGTFVNGLRLKRFQKYLLQDGDEIQLGDTVLIYREGI
jgi:pSer/pThr/pTyr-binding forkhead associated (FHA) protein